MAAQAGIDNNSGAEGTSSGHPSGCLTKPSVKRPAVLHIPARTQLQQSPQDFANSHLTPPATPQTWSDASTYSVGSASPASPVQTRFYHYLRASHHFDPQGPVSSQTEEECSTTVPISEGDVILVHSVQANGWADGTLLSTGERGWLPTNYCQPYNDDFIRHLLVALTYVWEFLQGHEDDTDLSAFARQDYVRSMIAGVRLLLERSGCLSRESNVVLGHAGLRRLRKGLLNDLSAFSKAARTLQERCVTGTAQQQRVPDTLYEQLDDILLKGFKVGRRAVRFLDLWRRDVEVVLKHSSGPLPREAGVSPGALPGAPSGARGVHGQGQGAAVEAQAAPQAAPRAAPRASPLSQEHLHHQRYRDHEHIDAPQQRRVATLALASSPTSLQPSPQLECQCPLPDPQTFDPHTLAAPSVAATAQSPPPIQPHQAVTAPQEDCQQYPDSAIQNTTIFAVPASAPAPAASRSTKAPLIDLDLAEYSKTPTDPGNPPVPSCAAAPVPLLAQDPEPRAVDDSYFSADATCTRVPAQESGVLLAHSCLSDAVQPQPSQSAPSSRPTSHPVQRGGCSPPVSSSIASSHANATLVSNVNLCSPSTSCPPPPPPPPPLSPPTSPPCKRASTTHRWSRNVKSFESRKDALASERLCATYDTFLGTIGVFIGTHMQSRSSMEVLVTTQRSVVACRSLLSVVEEVWSRDFEQPSAIRESRVALHERLSGLVEATKEIVQACEVSDGGDVCLPEQAARLVDAATLCVRAAGECVARSKVVIEQNGDFDVDSSGSVGLGISGQLLGEEEVQGRRSGSSTRMREDSSRVEEKRQQRPISPSVDKPLPTLPGPSTSNIPTPIIPQPTHRPPSPPRPLTLHRPPTPPRTHSSHSDSGIPRSTTSATLRPHVDASVRASSIPRSFQQGISNSDMAPSSNAPPSSDTSTPSYLRLDVDIPKTSFIDMTDSPGSGSPEQVYGESVAHSAGSAESNFFFSGQRQSHSTGLTQPSTRAPSPETPGQPKDVQASFGSLSDESDGTEAQLLTQTYAHELVFNREGQITGGSLPALVERLTIHDSTPDATFVNSFYLTFRLFTTPLEFSMALIQRFQNAGDSEDYATPVTLRVYNVFKSWLECHWRPDTDGDALDVIRDFAIGRLNDTLPAPSRRLLELVTQVSSQQERPIAPKLAALSRPRALSSVRSLSDMSPPAPSLSRSQYNLLKHWRDRNTPCGILDLDPLELARQFTILQSMKFCAIQPEELLAQEWTKKEGSNAVNVKAMSSLSTDLANLVADTILQLDVKRRAVMIKHWVKIAAKCLELSNYDALMAIICSLNSSMVLRLKKTWDLVSAKTVAKFDFLKTIVDVSRNYAVLRQRLQCHAPPCLPFVGIYLTDLVMVDEGNRATRQLPDTAPGDRGSVINFDKHMKTAKIIGDLQRFQVPYNLQVIPEMQHWMDTLFRRIHDTEHSSVQNYYRRSLLLEPREAAPIVPPSVSTQQTAAQALQGFGFQRNRNGSGNNCPGVSTPPESLAGSFTSLSFGSSSSSSQDGPSSKIDIWTALRLPGARDKN